MDNFQFTSESVCSGHPDKICDAISDAVVDAAYGHNPQARVAVETLVSQNFVVLAGEVTTTTNVDYSHIIRQTTSKLGYTNPEFGFSIDAELMIKVHQQSPDIARGVDADGAGDQGMMYGYACTQTANFMPLPIELAHALTRRIDFARETQLLPYLRPDGKAQVTIDYYHGLPQSINTIVLAVAHQETITQTQLQHDLFQQVVQPVINEYKISCSNLNLVINWAGPWHIPGPASDTGLTGRKIMVDTYGGFARAGGGAFSGKDATKVDRSGAYAARYLAKNIVAHGLADQCEVGLAYYIGAHEPVMTSIDTFNSNHAPDSVIHDFVSRLLDLSVAGIIQGLHLNQPIYQATSSYGHFGRPTFPWESINHSV